MRYLPDQNKTKFRLPLKLTLLLGSRPKSVRDSLQQCAHSVPDLIQIGLLSAELAERVNTVFCPVQYFHNSPEAMLRLGRVKITRVD